MLFFNPIIKLIATVFIIIIAGGAICFALKNKIEGKAKKIYERRTMLEVLGKRYENYLLLKADYAIVKDGLPVLRRALPEEDEVDAVVGDLDALAAQTNIIQNLDFESLSESRSAGRIKIVNFSASLTGNIGSFEQYFKKLQALPYFIEISGFNINNSAGAFSNNTQLSLKAKLYIKN